MKYKKTAGILIAVLVAAALCCAPAFACPDTSA